jgi:hypothetical protein
MQGVSNYNLYMRPKVIGMHDPVELQEAHDTAAAFFRPATYFLFRNIVYYLVVI